MGFLCFFVLAQIYSELAYFQVMFLEIIISYMNWCFMASNCFHIHSYELGRTDTIFFVGEKTRIRKANWCTERSHTCRWQSWKEPRFPDIWFPVNVRFPRGASPYHPFVAHGKHCLALFYSQGKLEEFEQFSKLCIFQCILYSLVFQCSLVLEYRAIKSTACFHCVCQFCGENCAKCTHFLSLYQGSKTMHVKFP